MEWVSLERPLLMQLPLGTTSRTVMNTLEEIMSENINTSQHTVFYVVHQYMKTMNRIDKPVTFERPVSESDNTLPQIQKHHQQMVKYISDFDTFIDCQRRRRQTTPFFQNMPRI